MSEIVVDASAILALVNAEPGWQRVRDVLETAVISAVNLSEVVAKLAENGLPQTEIAIVLESVAVGVVTFDGEDAVRAGLLRPATRGTGVSFGDRACLALGQRRGVPVLTADQRWRELTLDLEVRQIRGNRR
jgi:PIN domain nuclease of toxin-antitoxin system